MNASNEMRKWMQAIGTALENAEAHINCPACGIGKLTIEYGTTGANKRIISVELKCSSCKKWTYSRVSSAD